MNLGLIFVLLVSSVVLASGSSCEKNVNVTVQDPKYFKFDGGFFFIHGLTNGESVVMYKTSVGKKVKVQYIIINDDCLYEITRYNMNANGSFVDHVKLLKKPEELRFSKTLSFTVDGKAVEIKIKINPTGFVLNEVKGIKTFEPQRKEVENVCNEGLNANEVPIFELEDKNKIELNYMKNGRFFYQHSWEPNDVIGKYAFKSSSGDYYTFYYQIFDAFEDNARMERNSYYVTNSDDFSENIQRLGYIRQLEDEQSIKFCFKSTGVLIRIEKYFPGGNSSGAQKPTNSDSRPW